MRTVMMTEGLTTRYSMVYMEKEACPEKKDFLRTNNHLFNEAQTLTGSTLMKPF